MKLKASRDGYVYDADSVPPMNVVGRVVRVNLREGLRAKFKAEYRERTAYGDPYYREVSGREYKTRDEAVHAIHVHFNPAPKVLDDELPSIDITRLS